RNHTCPAARSWHPPISRRSETNRRSPLGVFEENRMRQQHKVGVTTNRFNGQVRRNSSRFPADFMFQLTEDEADFLRSQFATIKKSRADARGAHRKYCLTRSQSMAQSCRPQSSTR